jgi:hypothetical protein
MRTRKSAAPARHCLHCGEVLEPDQPVVVTVREQYAARSSLAALGELTDEAIALAHEPCQSAQSAPGD